MTNQLKRVNCSLFLDPVNSDADRYAVGIMQRWVEERRQLVETPSAGKELHHNLHRHKDIYLSGLFLHLLSPALTSQLSATLSENTIHMETLAQKLKMCGLVLPNPEADAASAQALQAQQHQQEMLREELARFQQSMASQLSGLQQTLTTSIAASMDASMEAIEASAAAVAQSGAQSVEPDDQGEALAATLAAFKADLGNELGQALRGGLTADITEAVVSPLIRELQAQHQAHSQSQAAEIADLKALISAQSQMIRALQHSGVKASVTAEPAAVPASEPNLSEQIASIRKVKKKGLF